MATIGGILDNVGVERPSTSCNSRKVATMIRGTGQCSGEASAVRFAGGVDSRRVYTELSPEVRDQVCSKHFIGYAGGSVIWALP